MDRQPISAMNVRLIVALSYSGGDELITWLFCWNQQMEGTSVSRNCEAPLPDGNPVDGVL